MQVVIVIALTFALCFAVDKGFSKVFRRKPQYQSGKSVRLTKKYMLAGILILFFAVLLAVAAVTAEGRRVWQFGVLAGLLGLMGLGFVIYFMSFGIFYDEDTFLCTAFGKRSRTYRFGEIKEQQLLQTNGGICVELFLENGEDVELYTNMEGAYAFLDAAAGAWCRAKGVKVEDCPWYDPANSCWFPPHDPEAAEKAKNATAYEMEKDEPEKDGFTIEQEDS